MRDLKNTNENYPPGYDSTEAVTERPRKGKEQPKTLPFLLIPPEEWAMEEERRMIAMKHEQLR